jgi:S-adenosylmethionine hydrolase
MSGRARLSSQIPCPSSGTTPLSSQSLTRLSGETATSPSEPEMVACSSARTTVSSLQRGRSPKGSREAVSITSSAVLIEPVSPSFHARDVLAPAAAHLAMGMSLDALGEAAEPESLVELGIPEPSVEDGKIACEVLDLNRFGNVQLNVRSSHLATAGLDQADRILVEAFQAVEWSSRFRPTRTWRRINGDS